ncbi:piggyBac transposable element-derived protein 4-like [Ixodes scapularis]|uniref:piggyBac transposable element-derived protein 4-like n=1 Tax=Ixodes scapularis TaxID=6945 RepID=UPI001A9E95E6|nr:piggyBac transposable element-derived protein 4-like [Ixodes scapularis]
MSVNPRHQLYHYWSSDGFLSAPEISKMMSFKRFQSIMNCLHVSDKSKPKKNGEDGFDRLAKVRPLLDALNTSFQSEYTQSVDHAVDECMIRFKGGSSIKQFQPTKSIKREYKVWARADSKSGYLLRFEVYEGKNAKRPANNTLGEHVVLSLSEGMEPGSQLYFDNYFTSTRLMEDLAERAILAVGTVRTNRKDLPEELMKTTNCKKENFYGGQRGRLLLTSGKD